MKAKDMNITRAILKSNKKANDGLETVRVILESLSDLDLGKFINELDSYTSQPLPSEPKQEIREEVLGFAEIMEQKLKENDHRPGWIGDTLASLLGRLKEETEELDIKINKLPSGSRRAVADDSIGDIGIPEPEDMQRECADIANFAMMIADNVQKLSYAKSCALPSISDEEIEKKAENEFKKEPDGYSMDFLLVLRKVWSDSAKWYRDRLLQQDIESGGPIKPIPDNLDEIADEIEANLSNSGLCNKCNQFICCCKNPPNN